MKSNFMASLLLSLAAAQTYNGNLEYFIADLGPTFPCHPKYERAYTWIDIANDQETLDLVLNSLVKQGFNGVRLPMWPVSTGVRGPDPDNETSDIGRAYCDSLSKIWITRIKTAPPTADYFGMKIYFSPALDNRALQTDLDNSAYADWVLSYTDTDYSPDFLSPFSSNYSLLAKQALDDDSDMSDENTMWEMDTLKILKEKNAWVQLPELLKPRIIGPDRASVSHSNNVFASFKPRPDIIGVATRPDYKGLVDIIGT